MNTNKRNKIINSLSFVARMSSVSIPNNYVRMFAQETINKITTFITGIPTGYPQVEDVILKEIYLDSYDYVITEINDILNNYNANDVVMDSYQMNPRKIARQLVEHHFSDNISLIEKENSLVIDGLAQYFREIELWVLRNPENLYQYLSNLGNVLFNVKTQSIINSEKIQVTEQKIIEQNNVLDNYDYRISSLEKAKEQYLNETNSNKKISYNNCFEEYMNKFNTPLFLESLYNEEETLKTLEDVYIIPKCEYLFGEAYNIYASDIYIANVLEIYRNYNVGHLGLILGSAGSGKSSLYVWFINHIKQYGLKRENVLVFRFSSFIKYYGSILDRESDSSKIWERNETEICRSMLVYMGYSSIRELHGNIILWDGFDECCLPVEKRVSIIDEMQKWTKYTVIFITCRENYITTSLKINNNRLLSKSDNISCIILQPFNEEQVYKFVNLYYGERVDLCKKEIIESLFQRTSIYPKNYNSVLGIPVILYMILATKIELSSEYSMADIYDKIFTINGYYKRIIKNIKGIEKKWGSIHADFSLSGMAELLQDFSHEMAFYIFEHNGFEDCSKKDIESILRVLVNKKNEEGSIQESQNLDIGRIMSASLFKEEISHIDPTLGDNTIRFVHRSMYEYFMADCLYQIFINFYGCVNPDLHQFNQALYRYIKRGVFTGNDILGYLERKLFIIYHKNKNECSKKEHFVQQNIRRWDLLENAFLDMMDGNLFCTDEDIPTNLEDIKQMEATLFANYIILIQSIVKVTLDFNNKRLLFENLDEVNRKRLSNIFSFYLKLESPYLSLDFSRMNISDIDLSRINLSRYNLSNSEANNTDFSYSVLSFVDFRGTNLSNAIFTGSDLSGALPEAKLIFESNNVPWAEVKGNYLEEVVKNNVYDKVFNFGNYPHHKNIDDVWVNAPIKWIILETRGEKALLLSKEIIDCRAFNQNGENTSWDSCSLRNFLNQCDITNDNGDLEKGFLSIAFSDEERERLCRTVVEPHPNIYMGHNIDQGMKSIDYIFLLSSREIQKYFSSALSIINDWAANIGGTQAASKYTEYANRHGIMNYNGKGYYWLRTCGAQGSLATTVDGDGSISTYGNSVDNLSIGVRPACWIRLK